MEAPIIERIKAVLSNKAKTPNGLANTINMVPSTVSRQLKGEQALSAKLIEGFLSTFPDISAEWLLRGEGEMYRDNSEQKKEISLTNPQDDSIWKAKYEAIKDCYDTLVSTLGSGISKKSANVG